MKKNDSRGTLSLKENTKEILNDQHAGGAGNAATPPLNQDKWSDPRELVATGLPTPQELTRDMLPGFMADAVFNHAERLNNTKPDFTATTLLIVISTICGGSIELVPKQNDDWSIPIVLWGALIGSASSMKTPSAALGLGMLQKIQSEIFSVEVKETKAVYNFEKKMYDKDYQRIQAEAEQAHEIGDSALKMECIKKLTSLTEPKRPYLRNVYINDGTVEAMQIRLSENPSGVLNWRDELSGFIASMNSQAREHERSFYLEAFNASKSSYVQERIGRENVEIDRVILQIFGGIQPSLIVPIVKEKLHGLKDDGFLERLLQFSVFPDIEGMEYTDILPDTYSNIRLYSVIETIAQIHQPFDPIKLKFYTNAQRLWEEWNREFIHKIGQSPENIQPFLTKQIATCGKLASIFHIYNEAETHVALYKDQKEFKPSPYISKETLLLSFKWIEYLNTHVKKIFALGLQTQETSSAVKLESKLPDLYPEFTKHQLSQKGWSNLKTAKDRDEALSTLLDSGYIKVVEQPTRKYLVHPKYAPTYTA